MTGGWVYMMSDRYRGGIYTGVTATLAQRVTDHREGKGSKFVAKYGFNRLVYMEWHDRIEEAIAREKAIKKWRRAWKIELIETMNRDWDDLYENLNT
ncbi:GIY-YIG nuclease family protein [Erythrobacter sp. EC-HK427]|uniref:GIY-YIG nuclease family protein n=1 Tax=Erythrobacter sp. EC-HK427 TaxID=2038396 RepID=UPI00125EF855|nr:GIY-YIG nuclease family protein [Erythrobacter sp. EC-HK427]